MLSSRSTINEKNKKQKTQQAPLDLLTHAEIDTCIFSK